MSRKLDGAIRLIQNVKVTELSLLPDSLPTHTLGIRRTQVIAPVLAANKVHSLSNLRQLLSERSGWIRHARLRLRPHAMDRPHLP